MGPQLGGSWGSSDEELGWGKGGTGSREERRLEALQGAAKGLSAWLSLQDQGGGCFHAGKWSLHPACLPCKLGETGREPVSPLPSHCLGQQQPCRFCDECVCVSLFSS